MNLFGGKRTIQPDQSDRIKAWTRQAFHLGDETTLMVTELECREPGCPPVETVIAVLDGPGRTRRFKVHKAAGEMDRQDVEALAKGDGHHQH